MVGRIRMSLRVKMHCTLHTSQHVLGWPFMCGPWQQKGFFWLRIWKRLRGCPSTKSHFNPSASSNNMVGEFFGSWTNNQCINLGTLGVMGAAFPAHVDTRVIFISPPTLVPVLQQSSSPLVN